MHAPLGNLSSGILAVTSLLPLKYMCLTGCLQQKTPNITFSFKQPNFFILSPEAHVCISFYSWQFVPLFHLLKVKRKNLTCCASPTVCSPFSSPTHTPVLLLHRSQSSSHPPAPRWRPGGGRTRTPQRCQLAGQTPSLWKKEQIQMRILKGVLLLTNLEQLRFFQSVQSIKLFVPGGQSAIQSAMWKQRQLFSGNCIWERTTGIWKCPFLFK